MCIRDSPPALARHSQASRPSRGPASRLRIRYAGGGRSAARERARGGAGRVGPRPAAQPPRSSQHARGSRTADAGVIGNADRCIFGHADRCIFGRGAPGVTCVVTSDE
eukprot:435224-Prymnesium_polylepis.1